MIISFSGLDGAGKTSHIIKTVGFFRKMGVSVRVINVYDVSIFSLMGKFLKGISQRTSDKLVEMQFDIESRVSIWKKILSFIRRMCTILDILLFRFFLRISSMIGDRCVICDRYYYDAIIQLYYLKMCSKHFYKKILKWIPTPDIPIFILVDPEEAFRRKHEYYLSYFKEKCLLYQKTAEMISGCKVVVSRGFDITQKEIERIIINKLKGIE